MKKLLGALLMVPAVAVSASVALADGFTETAEPFVRSPKIYSETSRPADAGHEATVRRNEPPSGEAFAPGSLGTPAAGRAPADQAMDPMRFSPPSVGH
jgi:hypothetical protein